MTILLSLHFYSNYITVPTTELHSNTTSYHSYTTSIVTYHFSDNPMLEDY